MKLSATSEQQDLQKMLRKFLRSHYGATPRSLEPDADTSYDRHLWTRMADELGLMHAGMPPSTAYQSIGTTRDLAIILEELGRAVDRTPYFESVVMAAGVLAAAESAAAGQTLDQIAEGTTIAAFVTGPSIEATCTGESWSITGSAPSVLHGGDADSFVVRAATSDGSALFLVNANQCQRVLLPVLDLTMPYVSVQFDNVQARIVAAPGTADAAVDIATPRWLIGLAALQVGNADSAFALVSEFVGTRSQFGRTIGSFQSVKHELVNVMIGVESARAAVTHAATAVDDRGPDAAMLAHHALAVAGDTSMQAVKSCVQLHGAIGFTWEHSAHVFLKRAMATRHLLGSPDVHREKLASALLDGNLQA